MYPSSTSSSSSHGASSSSGGALMRYGSAPSSLLATAVDSVISATREFSAHSHQNDLAREEPTAKDNNVTNIGLQRSYGFGGGAGGASPSLVRHSSSPAGFLNQLAAATGDNGFCTTRGIGGDNGLSRLNSQLSFTRQQSSTLSHISEENDDMMNVGSMNGPERKSNNCYSSSGGFGIVNNSRSWNVNETTANTNNTITFSMGAMQPNKRAKTNMENQFEFSMGMGQGTVEGSLDMTTMEKLMHIPQDSVPCKIRAKRGCATHPRSIAERERRTRISGKLKKLQILVPNMDKQTSYSDMLDLAVQHIKSLQNQVQKLNHDLENCTCGCNNKDL